MSESKPMNTEQQISTDALDIEEITASWLGKKLGKDVAELIRVLGGVIRPAGLLGDRHQGRCVREAGASKPSTSFLTDSRTNSTDGKQSAVAAN